MTTETVMILEHLHCIREKDETPHSEPYIWPALLWIDGTTAENPNRVGITALPSNRARVVIKEEMRPGESADIVSSVGVLSAPVEEGFLAMVLVVVLLEKDETPRVAVTAGFKAFSSELQAAVDHHLEDLFNPKEREQAIRAITAQVTKKVFLTIVENQSWWDLLTADQDDVIGFDTVILERLPDPSASTPVSLAFGGELGGGLLLYFDASQTDGGEVSNPTVIGQAGWADFKFLFAGADQAIYAVDELRDEPNRYEIEGHLEVR